MIEHKNTLKEIRDFLSSGSEKALEIELLAMKYRYWPEDITHSQIKDACAEILYAYCWHSDLSIEDSKILLHDGESYKTCSHCNGKGKINLI